MSDLPRSSGPRVVVLSYSDGLHDARSLRLAETLAAAGAQVDIYSRHARGLPFEDTLGGFPVHRYPVPFAPPARIVLRAVYDWFGPGRRAFVLATFAAALLSPAALLLALLGWLSHLGDDAIAARRRRRPGRLSAIVAALRSGTASVAATLRNATPPRARSALHRPWRIMRALARMMRWRSRVLARRFSRLSGNRRITWAMRAAARQFRRCARWLLNRTIGLALLFPIRPLAWAAAIEADVGPASVYHGMWAGSLPALVRLRRRYGGNTIYDSRDVYLHSRQFGRLGRLGRLAFLRFERNWTHMVDRVLTVNEPYAEILAETLGIARPTVVMNCPFRQDFKPRGRRFNDVLGLPHETRIVLYQGGLMTERGVEQGMDAVLQLENAVMVMLGDGSEAPEYVARAEREPYLGRVFRLAAVPAAELLDWTRSADVMLCVIQPTSLNHRFTTPQKLFEAMSVGLPTIASDLPGMAQVVRESQSGELVDPTDPAAIAAAIERILALPLEDFERLRRGIWQRAGQLYTWEAQEPRLLATYALLEPALRHAAHLSAARRESQLGTGLPAQVVDPASARPIFTGIDVALTPGHPQPLRSGRMAAADGQ